jgi:hypothetical protein
MAGQRRWEDLECRRIVTCSRARKYLVEGRTVDGSAMVVVGKIGRTRRLVILTVYLVEGGA